MHVNFDNSKRIRQFQLHPFRRQGRIRDFDVVYAGRHVNQTKFIHARLQYVAVVMISHGTGFYAADDDDLAPVHAGCMFTLHPDSIFHYGPEPGKTWSEYHLCLTGSGIQRWVEYGWISFDNRVHRLSDIHTLTNMYEQIIDLLRSTERGNTDRAVLAAAQLLLEMYYRRTDPMSRDPHPTAVAILHYLKDHLDQPIDFEDLAEHFSVSYSWLRQQVRHLTGEPPHRYLCRIRCETARRLLADTNLTVAEVGLQVGIDDPFSFSRTFKRTFRLSPSAFRKQSRSWQ